MKNNSFIRFLIAGLLIMSSQVYAQLPAIDSLKLIPANPNANDALTVICYTTFPYGGCSINTIHSEQQGNDILLMLDYNVGMAAYICHSVDTISIPNPGAGDFQLITTITQQEDILLDQDTLAFHIDPYLGLPDYTSNNFQVYPNPVENELKFTTNFAVEKLEIYSTSGQRIQIFEPLSDNSHIDVSNLEKGIYLVTVSSRNQNQLTQRIIKL
ncbi:T9SS type A sorting domain-containing protein [Fluviicola chungangensis]|uniref:T9SS type A sorting domain-containing protein n=1 Tax=Fluviicola chungangensis TaxID=2597671 RepID=A0A556MGU6_9FLAO|nr:T9SS type A sorting domain-containing protein [Fluviicola chungangensis]TSJ39035.1 T9SS type A sorting domain-containing protein [Fluviicola chungangensis]